MWMLCGRKAIPGTQPAAYFRPDDYEPEFINAQNGIPLYRQEQTKDYHPRPWTSASQQYYQFFVAGQNRQRYSECGPAGWHTSDKYLSRARIREHLRGRQIYGCWGNLWTNWFAIDVDYRGRDSGFFLGRLRILSQLADFIPSVRWCYVLNRQMVTGLHLIGLLPKPRLLEHVRQDVWKVLAYLEAEHGAELLQYKPTRVKAEDYYPLTGLEVYPATNHAFRLPYAADRITITDEWLNRPGEGKLKQNLIRFMEYVQDNERQAVPLAEVVRYLRQGIRGEQPKGGHQLGPKKTRKRNRGGGKGMGKIEPLKGRHLGFITGVVLGTEMLPEDTIG
jgi:hypothetical protein